MACGTIYQLLRGWGQHRWGHRFQPPAHAAGVRGLLASAASPGGFTASQLASQVVAQKTGEPYTYSSRQAAYDLKKFRSKGIVFRIGRSHRYETSPDGLRALSALVLLRDKILAPLLASATQPRFTSGLTHPSDLDIRHEALRREMWATLSELGLAA